jgi:stage II sporulation protein R
MKRFFIIFILFLILVIYIDKYDSNYYVIPDDSIRIRIIANSDSFDDQYIKIKVKQLIEPVIEEDLSNSSSLEESRSIIMNNLNKYDSMISSYLVDNSYSDNFSINYGSNYFPLKEYKGVKYESGNYESLVIKLGSGMGDNWWCVMFPPICSLEVEENSDIEYKVFVKELFDKYF